MSLRLLALSAYAATLVAAQGSPAAFTVSTHSRTSTSTRHDPDDSSVLQPTPAKGHFVEQFLSTWSDKWSPSKATKEDSTGEVSSIRSNSLSLSFAMAFLTFGTILLWLGLFLRRTMGCGRTNCASRNSRRRGVGDQNQSSSPRYFGPLRHPSRQHWKDACCTI